MKEAGLRVSERKLEASFKSVFKIVTLENGKKPFTIELYYQTKGLRREKEVFLEYPSTTKLLKR